MGRAARYNMTEMFLDGGKTASGPRSMVMSIRVPSA